MEDRMLRAGTAHGGASYGQFERRELMAFDHSQSGVIAYAQKIWLDPDVTG